MKHLNRFQNIVVRICKITQFNVNEALKEQRRQGDAQGYARGIKEKADCKPCPLYQADQRRLHTPGAYEPPSPTTEGKIAAQRMEDGTAAVILNPQGRYFQKRRKEFITTKLMPIAERPEGFLL